MLAQRDQRIPVTFDLPDGDSVALITWEFVVDKCNDILSGIIDNISLMNVDLARIDTKLDDWIPDDSGDDEEDDDNG